MNMKLRIPINFCSAVLGAMTYCTFAILAYAQYPLPFSPITNWLSDLGNQIDNPRGAVFYQIGVILSALFLAIWFVGLFQWGLKGKVAHKRLLAVSQTAGIFAALALIMSAIYPINLLQVHSFWSKTHFMMSGIGFGFSVAALRYHLRFKKENMYLGTWTAFMPTLMLIFGEAYWLEWITVSCIIVYMLSVGIASFPAAVEKPLCNRQTLAEGQ
jgi:hypothetical protein